MGSINPDEINQNGFQLTIFGTNELFQISPLFIRLIGDSLGLPTLSEDVVRSVSRSVTFKILTILNDARKFCAKSNRKYLLHVDIDSALLNRGISILNYNNSIYTLKNLQKVSFGPRLGELAFFNDNEISIDEYLNHIRSKVKHSEFQISLKAHWLAISGVQPCIPENPYPDSHLNESEKNAENLELPGSFYLQLYYRELTEASIGTFEEKRKDALAALHRDPSIKHLFVPLCSFIFQGIRVNIAAKNLAILIYIMRMVCSLLQNPAIPPDLMESHFHQLVPSILSCIVSPILCAKQFEENHWALRIYSAKLICNLCSSFENSIPYLRLNVAEVIKVSLSSTLDSISINTETKEMTVNDEPYDILNFPFGSHFGAFFTFSNMPLEIIRKYLVPLVPREGVLFDALNCELAKNPDELLRRDISKAEVQLLQILLSICKKDCLSELSEIESLFGKYFSDIIFQQQQTLNQTFQLKS